MFNSEENDVKAVFHEPHPEKETDKGAVKSVREFLLKAGIEPETFESETFVNDNE
ncbi:putative HicA protein [Calothrix parasitica NIES-267]|uniref:Putative HicA protein n=1 Tax=Calothrix parasitica NIES-267 TaxID=1973488 RepID=A0A1Z4LT53_9CYAN|nr:putative HicA protein [Calothrix parasitica NIES-267]